MLVGLNVAPLGGHAHSEAPGSPSRTSWFRCRGYAVVLASLLAPSRAITQDVAITRVTVIPATGAAPIPNATVLIRGRTIDAIGPSASVAVPRGARIIDGQGKYLIPGLIEMHAHTSKTRASALGLYIANGVTTVRDAGSEHAEVLKWRREIRAGTRVGPRLLIAGPYLESQRNIERMRADPPAARVEPFERARIGIGTPARAKHVVDSLAKLELDFFKIRTVQDTATYRAIVAAARENGKYVTGHVNANSPEAVVAAGQRGVEHGWPVAMDAVPRERRMEIWRSLATAGVGVTPTLMVYTAGVFATDSAIRVALNDSSGRIEPRRKYVSRFLVQDWNEQYLERSPRTQAALTALFASVLRNYREMREAGVQLMTGSDVAVLGIFPGSALHGELENFVTLLGMPPGEAIERATRIPAEFMGIADSIGTIQKGKVADLVLLNANPLSDIRHTTQVAVVISGGKVYDRTGIERILADVLRAEDLRVNDWRR